ncbi:hypothetical protein DL89DRAFT_119642 [Linderina pennispora]|uniref:Uncharacterized protein n=1 Tax=Linderina pennispora TaxID=61395 RepID=A0A1Y1WCB1_9FUNG|nr:uncharacterized protein DL89DRAFT_119642 [Linderina pennispora]ORX71082.1 hypothetical protein DL89DRAFT_119642 [Linderina pennispora]
MRSEGSLSRTDLLLWTIICQMAKSIALFLIPLTPPARSHSQCSISSPHAYLERAILTIAQHESGGFSFSLFFSHPTLPVPRSKNSNDG